MPVLPSSLFLSIPLLSLFFFACIRSVYGSALTTPIAANERLCFYADVDKAGEKIGVRGLAVLLVLSSNRFLLSFPLFWILILNGAALQQFYFAVQSGGSFDISYTVTSPPPASKEILSGTSERQGSGTFPSR